VGTQQPTENFLRKEDCNTVLFYFALFWQRLLRPANRNLCWLTLLPHSTVLLAIKATMTQVALARTKSGYTPIIAEPLVAERTLDAFSPSKHLLFKEMPVVHTMKELGLPESIGVSPIAVSEPFPLFTEDAVMRMRREVLSPEVFQNCQYSSNLAHCYLRGFANK
jgi:hypothetical protein